MVTAPPNMGNQNSQPLIGVSKIHWSSLPPESVHSWCYLCLSLLLYKHLCPIAMEVAGKLHCNVATTKDHHSVGARRQSQCFIACYYSRQISSGYIQGDCTTALAAGLWAQKLEGRACHIEERSGLSSACFGKQHVDFSAA